VDERLVALLGSSSRSRGAPVDADRAAYVLDALAAGVPAERIASALGVALRARERVALRAFSSDLGLTRAAVAVELGMPRNSVTRAWQGAFRRMLAPERRCGHCDGLLGPPAPGQRRFCSDRCRRAFGVTKPAA
jgi:hypothetical protein